jgi:hypothetical protein
MGVDVNPGLPPAARRDHHSLEETLVHSFIRVEPLLQFDLCNWPYVSFDPAGLGIVPVNEDGVGPKVEEPAPDRVEEPTIPYDRFVVSRPQRAISEQQVGPRGEAGIRHTAQ